MLETTCTRRSGLYWNVSDGRSGRTKQDQLSLFKAPDFLISFLSVTLNAEWKYYWSLTPIIFVNAVSEELIESD